MIDKTDALVLRVNPYSRSSHIVTWLTPSEGKIATIIKGAMRPKSAFLGQYDLFYTCELLYYSKERNGLHIARECTPVDTRTAFRSDWKAAACASYVSDIMQRVSFRGGHQPELFDFCTGALDLLCEHTPKVQFLFWFELQLAGHLGFSPRLSECLNCGTTTEESSTYKLSYESGGLVCSNCMTDEDGYKYALVGPDLLPMLRLWQSTDYHRFQNNLRLSTKQLLALKEILGRFMSYHLEINIVSRQKAFEVMTH
ncbi:DNA repair protein RecO [bacterium E08(2017)]|nr:DNA repair protein RecO [bacterium E08(2017)]